MLNPRQIEAFRTVIVTGGVTAAAHALHISQPAVTRLIHDLQYALGLKLFAKRGTRLVPTNEALSLYREVERQFVGLDRIERAAKSLRDGESGRLRIAALPTFNVGFLPRILGRFMLDRPGLEAAVYGSISSQVVDWVASGFCDVGFAQGPLDFPNIEVDMLAPVSGVAVLPEGHRLTEKSVLEPADFIGEPFVSLEQTTPMRYRIDAVFSSAGIARQARVETPLSMIACGLVAAGAGVAIVDPFTAFEFHGRGIVVRPFRPAVLYEIGVVWASGRFRSALALDFVDAVRAAVGERADEGTAAAACFSPKCE
ncbi:MULTISPECIES: LysR substrate-binding domain-containing protein [unclassified Bosea (in: a-proteobacteria)]|uniref:LysR substrate-binding domain-containing protein n=1 Tax=unclassified Bosea (in: a-proteobacteria) TaxID=2653178 RepID=UPI000F7566BD|nr:MULTISPECIES: LysR substrate-binding domain-containing protein [unclassified Bosea (in: a-proteobacteria)]AZO79126.1 transcriptional regulator [Bosea sp. Tri-49]RXT27479.1 transcriptional regulator [Bosea sp. Tri-39]RXT35816.1 transcriptional regulator [Bosea sp. Tri-54]